MTLLRGNGSRAYKVVRNNSTNTESNKGYLSSAMIRASDIEKQRMKDIAVEYLELNAQLKELNKKVESLKSQLKKDMTTHRVQQINTKTGSISLNKMKKAPMSAKYLKYEYDEIVKALSEEKYKTELNRFKRQAVERRVNADTLEAMITKGELPTSLVLHHNKKETVSLTAKYNKN